MSTEVFLLTKINKARELGLPIWVRMYDIVMEVYQFSHEYQPDNVIKFYQCSGREQEEGKKVLICKSGQIRLISTNQKHLVQEMNMLPKKLRSDVKEIWFFTVPDEELNRLESEGMKNPAFQNNCFILQSNTKVRQFKEDELEGKTIPFYKIVK